MSLNRSVGLSLLFLILGSGWVRPWCRLGPEAVLKEKGLTKSGHTFVIEDEKPSWRR